MEVAMLAPKAEVSLYPWKEPKERIPLAVRHIRSFLGRIGLLLFRRRCLYDKRLPPGNRLHLAHACRLTRRLSRRRAFVVNEAFQL